MSGSNFKSVVLLGLAAIHGIGQTSEPPGWKPTYQEPTLSEGCDRNALTMSQCVGERAIHSEAHLDQLTAKVIELTSPPQKELLQQADSLWKRFRDVSCSFDSSSSGGNSATLAFVKCKHAFTKSRINALSQYHYCLTSAKCTNGTSLYWFEEPK